MPLTGSYPRTIDDKQRLAIPKRLTDEFGEPELKQLYISPGTDKSLAVYSPAEFDRLARKISRQPAHRDDVKKFMRLFYARSEKADIDAQGRIRLPERLMQVAGLTRDVILLGVNDHAEIWDAKAWEDYQAGCVSEFDQFAEKAFADPL